MAAACWIIIAPLARFLCIRYQSHLWVSSASACIYQSHFQFLEYQLILIVHCFVLSLPFIILLSIEYWLHLWFHECTGTITIMINCISNHSLSIHWISPSPRTSCKIVESQKLIVSWLDTGKYANEWWMYVHVWINVYKIILCLATREGLKAYRLNIILSNGLTTKQLSYNATYFSYRLPHQFLSLSSIVPK